MAKRSSRGGAAPTPRPAVVPPPPPPRPPRPTPSVALPALPWTAHLLPIAAIVVLAAVLYSPALDGPFVYDDPNAITQSQLIRSLTPLTKFVNLSTRPLTDFSYAIDYAVGAYAPRSYHVTSLVLHTANAVLLYVLALVTLGLPGLAQRYGAARQGIALGAAALFAAHPLASESVAYVSSRSEVLSSVFYLTAVLSFALAATRGGKLAVAGIFFATGISGLCKESAASIPLALLLYDAVFLGGDERRRRPLHWRLIGVSLLPILIGGGLFAARTLLRPSGLGSYAATAGLGFDRFTWWQYLFTQFGVIVSYLRLTVLPIGQTFDYDTRLADSLFAPEVLLPFLLLVGLVILAWRWRRAQPLFAFAVGWTLLILAPTSSVMPIADLMVERRMYLALAGLMLFAAGGLWDLAGMALAERARLFAYTAVIAVLVAAASVVTWQRATLWGDAIALHEDGVAKAPGNPRTRLNLGVTYLNLGKVDKALESLQTAKQLYDRGESVQAFPRIGAFIHYNLGAVLYTRKQYDAAEPQLKRSLELGGHYLALRPMGNYLLAKIALARGDTKSAISRLNEAIKYQDSADWRVELANAYLQSGDRNMAISTLQFGLRRFPDNPKLTAALQKIQAAK
jgi:tetratricopeptide (TPR) repeat protein